ncbi:hypothetical protein B0H19DRAFT_1068029 [Mycena capillaripes]|nr:hypothetical protein B0H19DRAFT_1068029 [Mycena capillaripes]
MYKYLKESGKKKPSLLLCFSIGPATRSPADSSPLTRLQSPPKTSLPRVKKSWANVQLFNTAGDGYGPHATTLGDIANKIPNKPSLKKSCEKCSKLSDQGGPGYSRGKSKMTRTANILNHLTEIVSGKRAERKHPKEPPDWEGMKFVEMLELNFGVTWVDHEDIFAGFIPPKRLVVFLGSLQIQKFWYGLTSFEEIFRFRWFSEVRCVGYVARLGGAFTIRSSFLVFVFLLHPVVNVKRFTNLCITPSIYIYHPPIPTEPLERAQETLQIRVRRVEIQRDLEVQALRSKGSFVSQVPLREWYYDNFGTVHYTTHALIFSLRGSEKGTSVAADAIDFHDAEAASFNTLARKDRLDLSPVYLSALGAGSRIILVFLLNRETELMLVESHDLPTKE